MAEDGRKVDSIYANTRTLVVYVIFDGTPRWFNQIQDHTVVQLDTYLKRLQPLPLSVKAAVIFKRVSNPSQSSVYDDQEHDDFASALVR